NQEVRELFQFVNPGLTLPLRNTLSGRILRESTMEVHEKIELIAKDDKIAFDGWTNVVHQSILGAVLITSGGRSLVWGAEDMSGVRKTAADVIEQIQRWLAKSQEKELSVICVVTDSAGEYTAARLVS